MSDPANVNSESTPPAEASEGTSRRRMLAATLGTLGSLLAGCASTPTTRTGASGPRPDWLEPGSGTHSHQHGGDFVTMEPPPVQPYEPVVVHTPAPVAPAPAPPPSFGVLQRSQWAGGAPVQRLMNPMAPVRYITIHHDGMTPFYGSDAGATTARLESIRRAHRHRGWGDIGYHFAIDRSGRVWECRHLGFQGAHVKNHNPSNVGVMVLGNFEQQQPSEAQFRALREHLARLQQAYRVPATRIRTHQEWAPTLCPGRTLQARIDGARGTRGGLA